MDKIATLLLYTELQRVVEGWFPQLQHLHGSPSEPKEETLGDVYAAMIVGAKQLNPLKSKDKPSVPISNCVHPKGKLRGGGNASQSYIVCKDCHARWENGLTTAEIKKYMKDQKAGRYQGGLLGQTVMEEEAMDTTEWLEAEPPMPPQMETTIQAEREASQRRFLQMQQALQQEQARSREMERRLRQQMDAQRRSNAAGMTQGSVPPVMPMQAKSKARPASVVDRVADALIANEDYWPEVETEEILANHRQNQHAVEVVDLEQEEANSL